MSKKFYPCNQDVYERGTIYSINSPDEMSGDEAEAFCIEQTIKTGYPWDWHRYAGRIVIKYLSPEYIWCVYHNEEYVGSFLQGVFSSEEKAQEWIDKQTNYNAEDCYIVETTIDIELAKFK